MWPLTYESNLVEHASVWEDKFAEVAIHAQAKNPGPVRSKHYQSLVVRRVPI